VKLEKLDANTLALGTDAATSSAMLAKLQAAGLTVPTGQTYYIDVTTTDGTGKSTTTSGIASDAVRNAAESATLLSTDADGTEHRVSTATGTTYVLHKNQAVLTTKSTDLVNIDTTIADLAPRVTTDALQIAAFLKEYLAHRDGRERVESRRESNDRLDEKKGDSYRILEQERQRAEELREKAIAGAPAPDLKEDMA
jgi:hypothetical protein